MNRAPAATPIPRRIRALEQWIAEQVEFEGHEVILPRSGHHYTIFKPTEAGRDHLFAQAQADPDKQMPYWANIWPSGVALADAVFDRRSELAGRRVLELGCGLGTTATAVMEVGATLVAVDYSALPLAFARYNALINTGQSPRTLQMNWRAPAQHSMIRAETGGGFPIILAADVLYESRDIRPLLMLVDRLLTPDGMLWLVEPGRKTADRFLSTAAQLGWQGVSESASGPWPDGATNQVNLHFLRRPTSLDELAANLGGWRP